MFKNKKTFKNIFWIYFFIYISLPIGYLIRILYSRYLSLEEYGLFYSILGLFALISIFNDMGFTETLNYHGVKFFEKKQFQNLKNSIYYAILMQFITAIIISLILYLLNDFLSTSYFNNQLSKILLPTLLIYFIFFNVSRAILTTFIIKDKFFINQIFEPLRLIIILIVSVGLVYYHIFSIKYIAIIWSFTFFILTSIFYFIFLREFEFLKNKKIYFDKKLTTKLFKYAFPIMIGSGATILVSRVDIQIITYFLDLKNVALYINALALSNILFTIIVPISTFFFPLTTKLLTSKKNKEFEIFFNTIYKYILIIIMPIVISFISFPKEIIYIFFGENYLSAENIFIILSLGTLFLIFLVFNLTFIAGMGKVKKRMKIMYIGGFFNLIGDIIIVKYYGIIGVGIITSLTYFIMLILSFKEILKEIKLNIDKYFILKLIFSNIIFILIVILLKNNIDIDIYLKIVIINLISFLSYFIISYYINLINMKEIISYYKKIK